jgi:hypothetical protein
LLITVITQLKRTKAPSNLPLENFLESFIAAIRYVRYAPGIQVILARNILFAFFISVIPSLLPVVGLKELHLSPSNLGLVFTCMGVGSVLGAIFILPWTRSRFSTNSVTIVANLLVAVVFVMMAVIRNPQLFLVAAGLAGAAWTMAASELWVAGQRAMPGWARGRMNAIVIMAAQGAVALGGIVWGSAAAVWGITPTLFGATALLLASLVLVLFLSIDFTGKLDFEPAPISGAAHKLIHVPQPHDGPVSITIEFEVDRIRGREFLDALREVRLIHLRNGAFSWRLHEDLESLNTYRVELMMPSWTEYLLENERLTKTEKDLIDKAWALHIGANPPVVRQYLCVNRELHARRPAVARSPVKPAAPLGVDSATSVSPGGL